MGFVSDLISIGNKITDSKNAYDESMKKLHTGKDNLVSKVERIKILGAKSTKDMPPKLLDRTEDIGDLFEIKNE